MRRPLMRRSVAMLSAAVIVAFIPTLTVTLRAPGFTYALMAAVVVLFWWLSRR